MNDLLKNVLYTTIGAAFLTKDKIEELKKELVDKGSMTREEGKQFVEDLLKRSEKARDQLDLWISQRVEETVKKLDLATGADLADLKRKVEELQVALNSGSKQGEP